MPKGSAKAVSEGGAIPKAMRAKQGYRRKHTCEEGGQRCP